MTATGQTSAVAGTARHRAVSRGRRGERRFALLAVAPAGLLVLCLMLVPIMGAFGISFFKTDGVTADFVGLANYLNILTDPLLGAVLLVNLQFLVAVPLVLIAATLTAVLLYEKVLGWQAFRIIFFIPSVLSTAVIGLMFKSTFAFDGPVNKLVVAAGGMPISFFSTSTLAIAVIVLALVWSGFGYGALIVLAGLSAIDRSIYEAADLDGAGWWQKLVFITLPQIRRVLLFVSVINVIYTFTSLFGFVYVMTAGGPGYSTTTLDYLIYQKAFSSADMGSGSALAILVFVLIGVLTVLQALVSREPKDG